MKFSLILTVVLMLVIASNTRGQEAASNPVTAPVASPIDSAKLDPEKTPVVEIAPGVYDLRGVRMVKADRSVSFPAVVNLVKGPQEYFLVTGYGASHESVLRTSVQPIDLHVAMLLLGAKGAPSIDVAAAAAGAPTREPFKGTIEGDAVEVFVSWSKEDVGLSVKAGTATLTILSGQEKPLLNAQWVYNGSRLNDGLYMAQVTGNIISLIADEFSMMNYVGPGSDNDDIWRANATVLPKPGDSVVVTIRMVDPVTANEKN